MYLSVNGEDKAQTPLQLTALSVVPDYNSRNVYAFTGDLNREVFNENGNIQADYGYSIKHLNEFTNKGDVIFVEIDKPEGVSISEHMVKGNSNGGYQNQFIDDEEYTDKVQDIKMQLKLKSKAKMKIQYVTS